MECIYSSLSYELKSWLSVKYQTGSEKRPRQSVSFPQWSISALLHYDRPIQTSHLLRPRLITVFAVMIRNQCFNQTESRPIDCFTDAIIHDWVLLKLNSDTEWDGGEWPLALRRWCTAPLCRKRSRLKWFPHCSSGWPNTHKRTRRSL